MTKRNNQVLAWIIFLLGGAIWTAAEIIPLSPAAQAVSWLAFAAGWGSIVITRNSQTLKPSSFSLTNGKQIHSQQQYQKFLKSAKMGAIAALVMSLGLETLHSLQGSNQSSIFLLMLPLLLVFGSVTGGFESLAIQERKR